MENRMEIRQRIFGEHRLGKFAVAMRVGDDGPDFVFFERLVNRAPGVAWLGGLARETGVGGEEDFHAAAGQNIEHSTFNAQHSNAEAHGESAVGVRC